MYSSRAHRQEGRYASPRQSALFGTVTAATMIGERFLADIAQLPGDKIVTWSTAKDSGRFEMLGADVVGISKQEAEQTLRSVCRHGGGVIVQCSTQRKARDGHPMVDVCGYGCSQLLFTRLPPEEVEWTLTHDPKTFEPTGRPRHVRFI